MGGRSDSDRNKISQADVESVVEGIRGALKYPAGRCWEHDVMMKATALRPCPTRSQSHKTFRRARSCRIENSPDDTWVPLLPNRTLVAGMLAFAHPGSPVLLLNLSSKIAQSCSWSENSRNRWRNASRQPRSAAVWLSASSPMRAIGLTTSRHV